jgi:hypothetical protein
MENRNEARRQTLADVLPFPLFPFELDKPDTTAKAGPPDAAARDQALDIRNSQDAGDDLRDDLAR